MKSTITYVTRSQLFDYVTKREFNEFKQEMYNFRDEMYEFRKNTELHFARIDKRFNDVDRRFDELREEFRVCTGILVEEMREERKVTLEYVRGLVEKHG